MRCLVAMLVVVMFCGCVSQSGEEASTTTHVIPTTTQPTSTTTTKTTTTSTQRPTTTTASTTTTIAKTIECGLIENPMSRGDCDKGYCNKTGSTCRYIPGGMYKPAKCACI